MGSLYSFQDPTRPAKRLLSAQSHPRAGRAPALAPRGLEKSGVTQRGTRRKANGLETVSPLNNTNRQK